MELLAQGRMAEVFAYGPGRVVKLDRPEWNGVALFESDVLVRADAAGLPVARSHGVVSIEGRHGVVLDRVDGPSLQQVVLDAGADSGAVDRLARRFARLQQRLNGTSIAGLPDLVTRLGDEITGGDLEDGAARKLTALLARLDDGRRGVCHFDFHPNNVIVADEGWVVIDWLTVASGPPLADLARTMVLRSRRAAGPMAGFMGAVRREGLAQRGADEASVAAWVRVVAGARLAEGIEGDEATWLRELATGAAGL